VIIVFAFARITADGRVQSNKFGTVEAREIRFVGISLRVFRQPRTTLVFEEPERTVLVVAGVGTVASDARPAREKEVLIEHFERQIEKVMKSSKRV